MSEILILVPVYNEEENISGVIKAIKQKLPHADILFIDDGSEDRTRTHLDQHKVPYLSHAVNLGYGAAVQTGLKYAVEKKYPLMALMDGDGQHNPEDLIPMIEKLKKDKLDLVIGSRFLTFWKTVYPISFPRKLGMIFFSTLASLLTGIKIKDTTSGFQVFNLKTASFLQKLYPTDFPDAEIVILLNLLYFKTQEIPVKMKIRKEGKSMITFIRSLSYPFRMLISILVVLIRVLILRRQVKNA